MKKLLLILLVLLAAVQSFGQPDTTTVTPPIAATDTAGPATTTADSGAVLRDSIIPKSVQVGPDSFYLKLLDNPYLQMEEPPVYLVIKERVRESKEELFYLLAGLLLFLAFIKLVFPNYFNNIFKLFFQPSFRQKQTREQLAQNNLPSLLLNLFFVLSCAAHVALLLDFYNATSLSFWPLFVYSAIVLLALYIGKYLFISFAGWVFNVKEAAETYMFVVYLINKIIGVLILPFTLLIAFSEPSVITFAVTASVILAGILLLYRYVVSFGPVRRDIKVSPLHFLFYVFAFEVTPLLLIYKTLIIYLNNSV